MKLCSQLAEERLNSPPQTYPVTKQFVRSLWNHQLGWSGSGLPSLCKQKVLHPRFVQRGPPPVASMCKVGQNSNLALAVQFLPKVFQMTPISSSKFGQTTQQGRLCMRATS